jgi:hypothetical protein
VVYNGRQFITLGIVTSGEIVETAMVTLVLGYDTVYSAGTARSKIKLCGLSS